MPRWTSTRIPGTPPSVNELALDTRSPRYRRERYAWMQSIAYAMSERGNRLPRRLGLGVVASATLTFPTPRRRDEGNYRAHLDKWVGDLLQSTGRVEDDTPDWYRFERVYLMQGAAASMRLTVEWAAPVGGCV